MAVVPLIECRQTADIYCLIQKKLMIGVKSVLKVLNVSSML